MALIKCKECDNDVSTEAKACPKCGAKTPKKIGFRGYVIAAILIWIIISVVGNKMDNNAPSVNATNPASGTTKTVLPQRGEEIRLDDGGKSVILATTKDTFLAFRHALYANDRIGGQEMLLRGQIFTVRAGTLALVIDLDVKFFSETMIKVRIMEGGTPNYKYSTGWVVPDACRKAL